MGLSLKLSHKAMLWITWDPRPELFTIPWIDWPVLWYGLFFAVGFSLGFPLFASILRRLFLQNPEFSPSDILQESLPSLKERGPLALSQALNRRLHTHTKELLAALPETLRIQWKKIVAKSRTPKVNEALARMALEREFGASALLSLKKKASLITDHLTVYMVVATLLGARLGHFFFYERPSDYLSHPWEMFAMSRGGWAGLSSHGAALAILGALYLFSRKARQWTSELSWLRLLDLISIPTAFAGSLIRLGNFMNQEILGTPSQLPWAVLFLHPADASPLVPRHPVQLYESLFYCATCFLLWRLSFRPSILCRSGRLMGLFLLLVFTFRFVIESFKLEQSHILSSVSLLTMGQYLSLPFIGLGLVFLLLPRKRE